MHHATDTAHHTRALRAGALALALALGLAPARWCEAFCGMFVPRAPTDPSASNTAAVALNNRATTVVLMRQGTRTVLAMRNDYQGPLEDFAMVVPVPVVLPEGNVRVLRHEAFTSLDTLTAPRVMQYTERDPCAHHFLGMLGTHGLGIGTGSGTGTGSAGSRDGAARELGVEVEASYAVGEYDVVMLSAQDSSGLATWLRREHYRLPDGAAAALEPYVRAGMFFFVARVDPRRATTVDGRTTLSPLRFHYDSDAFALPIRLGLWNSSGHQDLVVYVVAPTRYEVANRPNVTIPTDLDVDPRVPRAFGAFYNALFDATVARRPGAVVTEYAAPVLGCVDCPGRARAIRAVRIVGGAGALPDWGQMHRSVITRLHVRYSRRDAGEDLVFREVPSGSGPREFRARYAVRHRWRGRITCSDPQRGVWDPVDVAQGEVFGRDLAFAPRTGVALSTLVRTPVPELGLRGAPSYRAPPRTGQ